MAQAQLDQEIAEKRSEGALAYQSNLLFQNVNQFVEKDQDFFLSDNVDKKQQKRKILPTKQSSFSGEKEIQESYIVQQKLNQESF